MSLSPLVNALEKRILSKTLHHGGHPILRNAIDAVEMELDAAGNRKPSRHDRTKKIDAVIATLLALDRQLREPAPAAAPAYQLIFVTTRPMSDKGDHLMVTERILPSDLTGWSAPRPQDRRKMGAGTGPRTSTTTRLNRTRAHGVAIVRDLDERAGILTRLDDTRDRTARRGRLDHFSKKMSKGGFSGRMLRTFMTPRRPRIGIQQAFRRLAAQHPGPWWGHRDVQAVAAPATQCAPMGVNRKANQRFDYVIAKSVREVRSTSRRS